MSYADQIKVAREDFEAACSRLYYAHKYGFTDIIAKHVEDARVAEAAWTATIKRLAKEAEAML